jgi:hypothetical protein
LPFPLSFLLWISVVALSTDGMVYVCVYKGIGDSS